MEDGFIDADGIIASLSVYGVQGQERKILRLAFFWIPGKSSNVKVLPSPLELSRKNAIECRVLPGRIVELRSGKPPFADQARID
jgi:hypothetical protein